MKVDWGTIEAEAAQAVGFPGHGWALTTFGAKVLWLPVKGTFTRWRWVGRAELASGVSLARAEPSFDAFNRTLHDLGVVLRELKRFQRLLSESARPLEEVDAETLNKTGRLLELARPALDLSYVYLRRLADRFAGAAWYLLFSHPQSVSAKFKDLRKMIENDEKLRVAGPLCDPDALRALFREHCLWFERLRGGPAEEHGLRDLLEHYPVSLQLQMNRVGEGPWHVSGHIIQGNPTRVGA